MWNYLYFIVLVRVKNKTDYTGPESYVAQMIKVRVLSGQLFHYCNLPTPGKYLRTRGLPKKSVLRRSFWKIFNNVVVLSFVRSWLFPLCNLSQYRIVYLMFCTVYLRIEPRAEPSSRECDFKVISRQEGREGKLRKENLLNLSPEGSKKKLEMDYSWKICKETDKTSFWECF